MILRLNVNTVCCSLGQCLCILLAYVLSEENLSRRLISAMPNLRSSSFDKETDFVLTCLYLPWMTIAVPLFGYPKANYCFILACMIKSRRTKQYRRPSSSHQSDTLSKAISLMYSNSFDHSDNMLKYSHVTTILPLSLKSLLLAPTSTLKVPVATTHRFPFESQ